MALRNVTGDKACQPMMKWDNSTKVPNCKHSRGSVGMLPKEILKFRFSDIVRNVNFYLFLEKFPELCISILHKKLDSIFINQHIFVKSIQFPIVSAFYCPGCISTSCAITI